MNPKIIMPFSTMAIAAVALLFASGPIISSQQALAFVYVHGHAGFYHGYGFYRGHGFYHGHGFVHFGRTVMTPHGIYHRGVTVGGY
jgi:hypothetical protein